MRLTRVLSETLLAHTSTTTEQTMSPTMQLAMFDAAPLAVVGDLLVPCPWRWCCLAILLVMLDALHRGFLR